ncbi:MucBP domain-containing protein, partial [Leuconostoc pseudomesenteroides]|uniref:MucBP domain-containing protein n=1 Tax=Leuconostoc pseudomesenteroides TaxID=33968 RepID=UPI0039E92F24
AVKPGDQDATVTVYYDHAVVPVNPENPQEPGKPINPDDPDSPTWPAGTDKASLTSDVNQKVHYQYSDGSEAAPDKTDSTHFEHEIVIDKVTGKVIADNGWKADGDKTSFDAKDSPVIKGYTPSKPASDPVDGLTQDSPDDEQTIVYTPNQESAKVTYIDGVTGKPLSSKDLTGDYGTTDDYRTGDTIKDYESKGYELVSDNYPADGVVYNEDGTVQSFEVHLTHGTTPVGPDNPQTPGEPIAPSNPDGPKWPAGTDQNSVTQTITRTINYLDKQTNKVVSKQVTEVVTYNRTAIVDKVTGDLLGYSSTGENKVDIAVADGDTAWAAADDKSSWEGITSPDLSSKGYEAPDLAAVAEQAVKPGDQDATVTVYYDHAKGTLTVNYVDQNGKQISNSTDLAGNTGDPYSTTSKDIPGYKLVKVIGNPTGNFIDGPQTVTYVYVKDTVAGGDVTAKYVDENGNPIASDVVSSGDVGDPYSTTPKDIPGYKLIKVIGNPTGNFIDEPQTVTYVYVYTKAADGDVTAKYVDENGNPISGDVVSSGNVGDPYSTTPKDIPGYKLVKVIGNPTGSFIDGPQTVTYIYVKIQQPTKHEKTLTTPVSTRVENQKITLAKQTALPKTGEQNNGPVSTLGAWTLAISASLVGLISSKNKRKY